MQISTCLFQLSHGILLGVVGSDIPLMEVMKLAPRYTVSSTFFPEVCRSSSSKTRWKSLFHYLPPQLGPHGYAFLITNNGYILAHPDLRPLVTPQSLCRSLSPTHTYTQLCTPPQTMHTLTRTQTRTHKHGHNVSTV